MKCECKPGASFPFACPVLKMAVGRNAFAMCRNEHGVELFDKWKEHRLGLAVGQKPLIDTQKYPDGPGTELKKLLSYMRLKPTKNCRCNKRARHMNKMGTAWCKDNVSTIVEWLRQEADAQGIPFSEKIALTIIRVAIWRAERKFAASQ